jgi:hypothetical protein
MGRKFKIQRVANITAPDGTQPVFYEIWDVISVDGEERLHRNADLSFRSKEAAEEWVLKNS